MALRSVIDVEVNDAGMDRLIEKVKQYALMVERLPSPTGGMMGRPGGASSVERDVPFLERSARLWSQMVDSTNAIRRNVQDIAQRVLSMTGTLSMLTGIATGFGMLGMDAIARTVSGWRSGAIGAGTTIGGMRAAQVELGRFGDMTTVMNNIRRLQMDPTIGGGAPFAFMQRLGVTPRPGEDTFNVLTRLLPRLLQFAQGQDPRMLGTMWQRFGLEQIMPFEQFMQLRGRPGELGPAIEQARRRRAEFDLTGGEARGFEDFLAKMREAAAMIETTFIKGIQPLAKPLGELSVAIADLLNKGLRELASSGVITKIAEGIHTFAEYIGTDDFNKQVQAFADGIVTLARAVGNALRFFGILPGETAGAASGGGADPRGTRVPGSRGFGIWERGGHFYDNNGREVMRGPGGSWLDKPDETGLLPGPGAFSGGRPWFHMGGISPISFRGGTPAGMQAIPVVPYPLPLPVTIVEGMWSGGGTIPNGAGGNVVRASFGGARTGPGPGGGIAGSFPEVTAGSPFPDAPRDRAHWWQGEGPRAVWLMRNLMKDVGLSPEQAAGLASVMGPESGINPFAVGPGGDTGIAQWVGSRKAGLAAFARREGKPITDPMIQYRFMLHELTGTPWGRKILENIRRQSTAMGAAGAANEFETGPGGAHDPHWLQFHSKDTQSFYEMLMRALRDAGQGHGSKRPAQVAPDVQTSRGGQAVAIVIRNEAGGNPIVTHAQVAA
jgi:hypothetical protein